MFYDRYGRIIDPKNDIYPNPIMTKEPSIQVHGSSRLICAMQYLCIDRINELIDNYKILSETLDYHNTIEERHKKYKADELAIWNNPLDSYEIKAEKNKKIKDEYNEEFGKDNSVDIYCTDYYGQNIFHNICTTNTGANFCYNGNEKRYNKMISLLLNKLPLFAIKTLLSQKSRFGRTPIEEALRHKLLHYAIAFLRYGSDIPSDIRPEYTSQLRDHLDSIFKNKERIKEIEKKEFGICSITLEPIKCPAILEDGSIYERDAIIEWIKKGNNKVSPLTNIKYLNEPVLYCPLDNHFIIV